MDYSDVLKCIREGMGPDGWLAIDASRPPTEQEKTSLSMRLNRELVEEIRANIIKAVEVYFARKEPDFSIGLPVGCLQTIYQELYGCLVRYEVLGFDSLASFCLAIDCDGFKVCKIGENYVLLPPLRPWYWPEPELEAPIILERQRNIGAFPKDVIGPDATLHELNYKLYLKPGEIMKITLTSYEDPLNFQFILQSFLSTYLEFKDGLIKFYSRNSAYIMPRNLVRPGQFCVVGYWVTERLILGFDRCRVLELINEGMASVILIDIGRKLTVPVNGLRFLHKQFASFPIHSLPGRLAGIVPKSPTLDEATKTRINFYLHEPYLEAELYSPDFSRPLFPLIVYSRYSRISLNRVLIDSGKFSYNPFVPYSILTRKEQEVEPKYKFTSTEEENCDCEELKEGRIPESKPLLNYYTDSETDSSETEFDETDYPNLMSQSGVTMGSNTEHNSSSSLPLRTAPRLCPAASRTRPVTTQARPRPFVSRPKSAALRPIRPPPNNGPDVSSSNSNCSDSKMVKPIHIPQSIGQRSRANKEKEENPSEQEEEIEKPKWWKYRSLSYELLKNMIKQDPDEDDSQTPNECEDKEEECQEMPKKEASDVKATSSPVHTPQSKNVTSLPNKNLVDKSKASFIYFPSTSKQATAAENASCSSSKEENRSLINLEDDDVNAGKDCLYPPSRPIFFDVEKTDFDESDSSETTSEIEDSCEASEDVDQLWEEMEINLLLINFLSWNPIIREISMKEPQVAYKIAKAWTDHALLMSDGSRPDVKVFNPFMMCVNTPSDQLPSKLRSLIEMVPKNIYKKYWSLAKASRANKARSSSAENSAGNANQLPASKFNIPLEVTQVRGHDDSDKDLNVGAEFEMERAKHLYNCIVVITKLNKTKRTRYNIFFEEEVFEGNKEEVRMISKVRNADVIKKLREKGTVVIKWDLKDIKKRVSVDRFQRFFFGYSLLQLTVAKCEREIKKELLGVKKR